MDSWLENWVNKLTSSETGNDQKTILIIGAYEDTFQKLKLHLEPEGYKTLFARDGKQGLNLALKRKPDLIICDELLPGMDGQEVLHLLLLSPISNQPPFIFSSSHTGRLSKTKALALGADNYLIKPFEPENLVLIIKTLLKNVRFRKTAIAVA